jgi:hypothetical protein
MHRSRLSFRLILTAGACASMAIGCASGGSTSGTGGNNPGVGGNGTPGTGGGSNPGTGGGVNPGTGGGINPGTGGGGNPGTGGGVNPGTGGGGRGGIVGSTGGAGGGVVGGTPAGYWSSGAWHGCSWTGVDILRVGTMNMPQDFQTHTGTDYCVSGSVGPDPLTTASVALLGFNLNEPVTGVANQCAYNPATATMVSPGTPVTLTGSGLAVSYVRKTGSNLRVQIQGPNGATDPNNRWCYTITQVQGPIFAPFNQFNTRCWDGSGTAYAGQPISAVSFLVPGLAKPSPFSYCVGGFAAGTSVAAAPPYTPTPYPTLTGTIGGPGIRDIDFERVKVAAPGVNGKAYLIQNNNWGTPDSTDQTINYSGNSFTIMSTTGNVTGAGVPASFPSIYIGANGQTPGQLPGVLATTPDNDGLPRAISAIGTLMTSFSFNRASGDYNATYDVWLAAPPAPAIGYNDALSGFVMVWLYQPPTRSPIGTMVGTTTIGGRTWNVWAGARGIGTNPNRPVVSYVSPSPVTTLTFDMKPFLADAAVNASIPTQFRVSTAWLVTDLFAGFEIWTGSSAAGLQATSFSATVQ